MNTCIFTFSPTSKNMSEIGNIVNFSIEVYRKVLVVRGTMGASM